MAHYDNNLKKCLNDLYDHLHEQKNALPPEKWLELQKLFDSMYRDQTNVTQQTLARIVELASNTKDVEIRQSDQDLGNYALGISYKEIFKQLYSCNSTKPFTELLLHYASWIQVHGWSAVPHERTAFLQEKYKEARINIDLIDFSK